LELFLDQYFLLDFEFCNCWKCDCCVLEKLEEFILVNTPMVLPWGYSVMKLLLAL